MSRIGKEPVTIPAKVTVQADGGVVAVKGPLGSIEQRLKGVNIAIDDGQVTVTPVDNSRTNRALWGLGRALIQNMVTGVSEGFTRVLEINGVGYRAQVQGKVLKLSLGYSHDVDYAIPAEVQIVCPKPTEIEITGIDQQRVGQVAAEIRAWRGPEPFKGKGVKYKGEYIFRKEGKKK